MIIFIIASFIILPLAQALNLPVAFKQPPSPKRFAMLLSGGVDSSVALALLKKQHPTASIHAFYLRIHLEEADSQLSYEGQCPWEDDWEVCSQVCNDLSIPLQSIPLEDEYRLRVVDFCIEESRKGRTPNPDVMCNRRIKFGAFVDKVDKIGDFDLIASGHYAHEQDGRLYRSVDSVKDQSYFLSTLTPSQLSRVHFPLGRFTKKEVRDMAKEFGLVNAKRRESQGLCFLGKIRFDQFISGYLGENPGLIVDARDRSKILGQHKGLWFHTIGQRKGVGELLTNEFCAFGPWYVVSKDVESNVLLITNDYDEAEAERTEVNIDEIELVEGGNLDPENVFVKLRHGPEMARGKLILAGGEGERKCGRLVLEKKDKGLAPGQFVVFYGSDKKYDEGDVGLGNNDSSEVILEDIMEDLAVLGRGVMTM